MSSDERTSRSMSAITLSAGRVIGGLINLVSAMILARLLTQQDYGSYRQVWLVYETVLPFLMFGLPASVTYYIPQFDRRGQKMVVVQSGIMLALAGLLLSVFTYMFAEPIAAGFSNNQVIVGLLRSFFWFPILSAPLLFVDSFLIAIYKPVAAALYTILSAGIQFGSLVIPVVLGYDLKIVMLALNLGALLRFLVIAIYVLREYRDVPLIWNVRFVRRQLQYSVPLGLSSILGTITRQLDRLAVSFFFGAAQYAIYVNGATELPFVGVIAGSVMTVVIPEFIRLYQKNQNAEIVRLWHSATRKVALLFFPLTAVLMVFAKDAIIMLFSDRYLDSVLLFRIFLLLLPLRIATYGSLLMAAGKSSWVLKAAFGTVVLNIPLVFILLKVVGLPGAAIATVVSVYAMGGWQLLKGAQLLQVPFGRIMPWRSLGLMIVISSLSAGLSWLLVGRMPVGLVRLSIGGLLFLAIYAPLIWFTGGARGELADLFSLLTRYLPLLSRASIRK